MRGLLFEFVCTCWWKGVSYTWAWECALLAYSPIRSRLSSNKDSRTKQLAWDEQDLETETGVALFW